MERNKKGQFIKGTNGETFEGFGVWYTKKGYPTIWINGKSVMIHVYIWERVNGEKPKGMQLHHIDYNKKNYNLCNLRLVTQSDHFKIHAGWIRGKGVWVKKPCKDCKKILYLNEFYPRKGLTPSNRCIGCSSIYSKNKLINDSEYRENRRLYLKEYYHINKSKILAKQKERYANL